MAPDTLTYIDLFAGCGGLSLGLQQAGWQGLFAVERSPMAFETLKHNLASGQNDHFPNWPTWLPREASSIQSLTKEHRAKLEGLRGQVMLIAGGPPCQGFSYAGKRVKDDHRNQLYKSYIEVVQLVRPALVLLENVTGIQRQFGGQKKRRGRPPKVYSERIRESLEASGYRVFDQEVRADDFGVPQSRTRFVAVGIDLAQFPLCPVIGPFSLLSEVRAAMLAAKGLHPTRRVTASQALSDLLQRPRRSVPCPDTASYKSGKYAPAISAFQRLMRGAIAESAVADSHRFVKHRAPIVERFALILSECRRGTNISNEFRERHDLKKACITPLSARLPAPTITTIPDDMIHYSQPRVLTVRECARLQSFPDSFEFKSKYTTGGKHRKKECPRYTQVGNAVPPLLGEALGRALLAWIQVVRPAKPATAGGTDESAA